MKLIVELMRLVKKMMMTIKEQTRVMMPIKDLPGR